MRGLFAPLRRRDFALLWFGGLISMTGDWMLLVALPIYVYQRTGSALATGTMFAAGLLPTVLFGLIDLAIFLYPAFVESIAPGLVLFVLVGVPATGMAAGLQTLLQTSTEDRYRGRVFGALGTTQALLMLVGTLAGGALGDAVGIVPVLVVQGGAHVAAGLLVLAILAGNGKGADHHPP